MNERLAGQVVTRSVQLAEPFVRTRVGSGAVRVAIHYEAFLRRGLGRYEGAFASATGYRNQNQRRLREEHAERRRLAPGRPTRGRGVPKVFWHGPDGVDGTRPLIVLINGWTASGLVWPRALIEQLESEADLIRIDTRASGYSRTSPAPFTIAELADDVADVIRFVGARSALVAGLSMGGMIAQELALRHPRMVERLVLCGTRAPIPAGYLSKTGAFDAVMSRRRPAEAVPDFFRRTWGATVAPGFASERPELMDELVDRISERPTPLGGVLAQMRALATWTGPDRLARITSPTIVIHGREDPLFPVGNGMRLAQLIPGARYVELPDVGHLVPFEAQDVLTAGLLTATA
jgi:3-oxoadipate enol-lactonase